MTTRMFRAGASGRHDGLVVLALVGLLLATLGAFIFFMTTDGNLFPAQDQALEATVLRQIGPRLTALGVERMVWAACRMEAPFSAGSAFETGSGNYEFDASSDEYSDPSGGGAYPPCDNRGPTHILVWSFLITRASDGSFQLRAADIDHDVPFPAYSSAAVASADAALAQLDQRLKSTADEVRRRVQAQASWQAER